MERTLHIYHGGAPRHVGGERISPERVACPVCGAHVHAPEPRHALAAELTELAELRARRLGDTAARWAAAAAGALTAALVVGGAAVLWF